MKTAVVLRFLSLAIALASNGHVLAQTAASAARAAAGAVEPGSMEVLKGSWVRPDGGYVITIKAVAADGKLEATYANPAQLPFAAAQATREGGRLRAFFELRAGGYGGSTYELSYEPMTDRLTGTYYQAVAKQKFEVFFNRNGPRP